MFNVLNRLKELREERGWSVYKLAKLSTIPQSTIATWYQKNLYPPIDKLELLCNTFGISLSEFFSTGNVKSLSNEQLILLNQWNLLSSKERLAILNIMEAFLDNRGEIQN